MKSYRTATGYFKFPAERTTVTLRVFSAFLAFCAVAATLQQSSPAQAATNPNRWALMSDIHLNADPYYTSSYYQNQLAGANFDVAVNLLFAMQDRPAGLIIAGDMAYNTGPQSDYQVVNQKVQPIRDSGMALHFAMGNHDNLANFYAVMPWAQTAASPVAGKHVEIIETQYANWFILDSLDDTAPKYQGELGTAQLNWLAQELDARPDKPALVLMHHYPGDPLGTGNGLRDTQQLYDVMAPREQVKALIYGHSHQFCIGEDYEGIHLINIPSTWYGWPAEASNPAGWLDVLLEQNGMEVTLHTKNPLDYRNNSTYSLSWRGEPVPEPGTLALLLVFIGASISVLWVRVKRSGRSCGPFAASAAHVESFNHDGGCFLTGTSTKLLLRR